MAEKLNICIVVVVVLAVVLLYTFIKHKPDYLSFFSSSSKFEGEKKMILVGPKGEIELKNASEIDTAINDVTKEIQTRALHLFQPKGNYQPSGDYVRRGGWYRLYNRGEGGGRQDWLALYSTGDGDVLEADKNMTEDDTSRYFKIGGE